MRLSIDGPAWNRGFHDGEATPPLRACPYAAGPTERWSWSGGYKKTRPPLRPTLVRYAPRLRSQQRQTVARVGSKLHAGEGSKFGAD